MKDKVIKILEKYVSDGYRNEKGIYECDIDDVADELVKLFAIPVVNASCCPKCGAPEVEAMTPRTKYKCGSSDYDQRPNTFKQTVRCKVHALFNWR